MSVGSGCRAIGLDGFRNGWVAVLLDGDLHEIRFCDDVAGALSVSFDRAAIDIPIGMTDDGERAWDLLARERLRPHSSRVFTGSTALAVDLNFPIRTVPIGMPCSGGQKRVSRQLWHLGPKIMEVDSSCAPIAPRHSRGSPELVFLRLNGLQATTVEEIGRWNSSPPPAAEAGRDPGYRQWLAANTSVPAQNATTCSTLAPLRLLHATPLAVFRKAWRHATLTACRCRSGRNGRYRWALSRRGHYRHGRK